MSKEIPRAPAHHRVGKWCLSLFLAVLIAGAAPAAEKIVIEAEDALGMSAPFTIRRDERAAGGMSVGIPDKSETDVDASAREIQGTVRYRFKLEKDGKYAFWARKWWMDGCGNSVKLNVDELPAYLMGEDGTYEYWDWIKMPIDLELRAGTHHMKLHNNEDGVWIDQIVITDDLEYVPAGQEAPGDTVIKERDIYMTDDFMRAQDQTGAWTVASGSWRTSSLDHPERSANAFQYVSEGEGNRVAVTGYPFWRDYSIEAAAMSEGPDVGFVLFRSDDDNYYLWRVPVTPGRKMTFTKVADGKEEVLLATSQRLRAGQWYKLGATAYRGNILLEIDDNRVASVSDMSHLKGSVGLFSAGEGQTCFDDVFIKSAKLISDDFSDSRLSGWQVTENAFRVYTPQEKAVALAVVEKGLGRRVTLPSGEGAMLLAMGKGTATTGTAYWHDYTFSFDVLPHLPTAWSVVVGRTEDSAGTVFTLEPTDKGVSVSAAGDERVFDTECDWTGNWHRVRIDNRTDTLTLNLDGKAVLQGGWPDTAGRAGFESGGGGVLFDNVSVRTYGRPTPKGKITPQFTLERTMMNWASLQYEWEPNEDGKSVWNRLDFLGDVELAYKYGEELAAGETVQLGISPVKGDGKAGPRVAISGRKVELFSGKGKVVTTELGKPGTGPGIKLETASLRRAGDSIVASINGRDILRRHAPGSDGACRLWVSLSNEAVKPDRIFVRSKTTEDYVMGKAPVEWRISNGHFAVTNRWKCDPRWSWFCIMSPAESIMWNKRSFCGDISADMWTGMKMELRRRPTYGDPGDMNLTICADGRSLGTGYSFIYGGYDNTASRLLRNDKVVAETTEVLAPSTRHNAGGLHRRWFHLAMKKKGGKIGCFLDEKLILKYEDPVPLEGTRVAAWTFDNGMMMSRIRISSDGIGPPEPPLMTDPSEPEPAPETPPEESPSDSRKAYDFEGGPAGWAARKMVDHFTFDWDPEAWEIVEDNSREVSVRSVAREDGGRCLMVENLSGGGTFAAEAPLSGTDLLKLPVLRFDYSIPPDVAVNLYMKAGNRFYSLALSGHTDSLYGLDPLGGVGAVNDGKWHTAEVNLRDRFLHLHPQAKSVVLDDVFIGNMDNRKYLLCGIGGNHAGAAYRLDNVTLFRAENDDRPPKVTGTLPWQGGALSVQFDDIGGTGVDPKSIVMRCGDRIYSLDHPALGYDALAAVASVDPVLAGMAFKDGGEAELHVVKLGDFAGNTMKKPARCAWKTTLSDDNRPPSDLKLASPLRHPANSDFETDMEQWQALSHKYPVELERCPDDPAQGRWCLRVMNTRVGGPFRCTAVGTPYDAEKFPIVSFFYKITKDVDVDLTCVVNGMRKYIKFADENSGLVYIGAVPNVVEDGKWHRVSFNLGEMLVRNDPYAETYMVKNIEFGDWGWMGNARGAHFFVDDFRIEPVYGTAKGAEKWKWSANDPFGVSKALYRQGKGKWTPVPGLARSWLPAGMAPGINTVSIKVADPSGNWSAPVDETVVFDPAPPILGKTHPAAGTKTASGEITVSVADEISGIDMPSIGMTVNGRRYGTKDPQLTYDFDDRLLVFRRWGGGKDPGFEDGKPVNVEVTVKDNAGNESVKKFDWLMDFARDKTGPRAPYVVPVMKSDFFRLDFEGKKNDWRKHLKFSGARVSTLPDAAATGRRCLALYNTYEGSFKLILKPPRAIDAKECPLFVFDYKIEGEAKFNLFMKIEGGAYDVFLTEPKKSRRIGRLASSRLISDGNWHRAVIDLGELALKKGSRRTRGGEVEASSYKISQMYFGNNTATNPRKARLYLDNICIAPRPEKKKNFDLEWTNLVDATGIASYSYCLDMSPKTEPTEEKEKATSTRIEMGDGEKWFFHVRGRDGAGNWGETSHYRVKPLSF